MIRLVLRWASRLVAAALAVVVVYLGVTFAQVWWTSTHDDAVPASAIVVMGAAQWNGRPSPVLQARLDHAAELWRAGVAPVVVVTGGKQEGDTVTQGLSGYRYLRDQGLPDGAVKVEVGGTDSYEELAASALILRQAGLGDDVVIVTDPYHAYRARAIAEEVGLTAQVSSTGTGSSLRSLSRETAAVAVGRLIGFRRLSSIA